MKFGSWTYDGNEVCVISFLFFNWFSFLMLLLNYLILFQVDLMHMMQESDTTINDVSAGINLTEFYPSVEWDILEVPAKKNEEYFPCCEEPYPGK